MKEKIYQLYRECFDKQTIDFQEFFVESNFNGENASTFCEGDDPMAMVFVNDGKLAFYNSAIDCSILTGLCVCPDERKKGFGRKLVLKTLKEQREKGAAAVRLMSDDLKFFEPLGFVPYCFSELKSIFDKVDGAKILTFADAEKMLAVYEKYCENFYIKPQRSVEDMQKKIVEYLRFGFAMGVFKNGELVAYSLEKDQNHVDEACFVDKFFVDTLGINTYKIPSFTGHPEGLIRVVNIEKFLNEIEFHKDFVIDWKIKFTDELLKENDVTLKVTVKNGKCHTEKLDREDFDIEYLVPDFASTVVRASENVIFG
ncbi:MAG: GNAT family N-acetyltransferase [Clostridia bacterium]